MISTASLVVISSIKITMCYLSLSIICVSFLKYLRRVREFTKGVVKENYSDFYDIYSPVIIAGLIIISITTGILMVIEEWETARYNL